MASISGTTRSGFSALDQRAQRGRVAHRDGAGMVRHLLARGVVVAVDRDGLDAQALQRDQHLLAQFAGAQQHHTGGDGDSGVPRVEGRLATARIVQPELQRFVVLAESPRRPHTLATREVRRLVCSLADRLDRG
jgi:hypothetical protein